MPAPTPESVTDRPDDALVAWESQLESLVIKWGALDDAWPNGRTEAARHEIGRQHRQCLDRIRKLHELIVSTEARSVAGAAVHLRRVEAMLDRENPAAMRLLASARKALEAHLQAAGRASRYSSSCRVLIAPGRFEPLDQIAAHCRRAVRDKPTLGRHAPKGFLLVPD